MIHDAIVPVTCDNECGAIQMIFCLKYPMNDKIYAILEAAIKGHDWTVIDGKHYCSEACAKEAEDGK